MRNIRDANKLAKALFLMVILGGGIVSFFPLSAHFGAVQEPTCPAYDDLGPALRVCSRETWTQVFGPWGGMATTILPDPKQAGVVYVGNEDGGIYKSSNGGQSWQEIGVSHGLNLVRVWDLTSDPMEPGTIYAGVAGHGPPSNIYKSTDGGDSWRKLAGWGLPGLDARSLALDPSNSKIMYVAIFRESEALRPEQVSAMGFFKSTDGGESWSRIGAEIRGIPAVIRIDPRNPATLYAASHNYTSNFTEIKGGGIYKSVDGGMTWERLTDSLGDLDITTLVIDPFDSKIIYAGMGFYQSTRYGLLKSTDGGTTWAIVSGIPGANAIASNPAQRGMLYVGVGTGVFVSRDGGTTWRVRKLSEPGGIVRALAADPVQPNRIYAGLRSDGVFVSSDSGESWTESNLNHAGFPVSGIAVDPRDARVVYAGGPAGRLFKTMDGGATWTKLLSVSGGWQASVVVAKTDSNRVYFAAWRQGLYKSIDAGRMWKQLPLRNKFIRTLAVHPSDPNTLYVGTGGQDVGPWDKGEGIFKSADGGESWRAVNQGLTSLEVVAIAIDPNNPQIVYAGTYGQGVFKSGDGGESWVPTSQGLTSLYVHTLAINPQDPRVLYAGTFETFLASGFAPGVFKSEDGGSTWRLVGGKAQGIRPTNIEGIVVDPQNPQFVYLGTHGGGAFWSPNGGNTWREANWGYIKKPDVDHVYAYDITISADGEFLYIGSCGRGLFRNSLKKPER